MAKYLDHSLLQRQSERAKSKVESADTVDRLAYERLLREKNQLQVALAKVRVASSGLYYRATLC